VSSVEPRRPAVRLSCLRPTTPRAASWRGASEASAAAFSSRRRPRGLAAAAGSPPETGLVVGVSADTGSFRVAHDYAFGSLGAMARQQVATESKVVGIKLQERPEFRVQQVLCGHRID